MAAVVSLASVIETRLRTNPAEMAGLFAGLVAGSIVVAVRMVRTWRPSDPVIAVAVAAAVFAGLGLRAGPVADPSVLVFAGAGHGGGVRHDPARHQRLVPAADDRHVRPGHHRRR